MISLEQLTAQATLTSISSEQDLYVFFLIEILSDSSPTILLSTRDEVKKLIEEVQKKPQNHQGKNNRSITVSDRFVKILSQQKQLLATTDDTEFALLLASLKMLEELGHKTNYKDVLKEIMMSSLHKLHIPPLPFPLVGREREMADIFRILDRSHKNNVLIVGTEGIGKTTLAQAVLQKLRSDIAFQLYPGNTSLSERIISLLSSINENRVLLFLDEIFSFVPQEIHYALDNKQTVVIATTNDTSFAKFEKNHPEIVSKFEVVRLEKLSTTETKQLLEIHVQELQKKYGITAEDGLVDEIYALSKQYLPHVSFPAKAIYLLEESVSLTRSLHLSHVKKEIIKTLISSKTHIPVGELTEFDKKDLSSLPEKLRKRVKGQDQAISHVVKVIQRSRLGFGKKNKPIGSFLFVGPSGVGKTELAKAVAQTIFGDEENMVRLDMSEFTEAHTIQRLIGAPPGYVGFEEGGQLTNPVKAKPYNLVLLDEIEKAHTRVFDIFLQVLDDGRLTDGQGKLVDFRHTIIIATSNAGLDDILDLLAEGKSTEEIEKEVKEILQDYFRIEFINRFDGIIFFNSLIPQALEEIAVLQIEKLKTELAKREIDFTVSEGAIKEIARMSYDPRYGARELLRIIQDTIENKLAEMIISGQLQKNQKIVF